VGIEAGDDEEAAGRVPVNCVDMDATLGDRFRVFWEADGVTRFTWAPEDRKWLRELRGKRGTIYPKGGTTLVAYTAKPNIGKLLRALPCVSRIRLGDKEVLVEFDVSEAETVLGIIRPYKRRKVSEALRVHLAKHAWKRKGVGSASEGDLDAPQATNSPASEAEDEQDD
jgi:hypothetical protein